MAWYELVEVADRVYAVIDVDGGWFRSNTGLVDMGSYTLVVDTQYNEPRAREVLGLIRRLGLPERVIVVNTHHHGDHAFGNHVFPGPAVMHTKAAELVDLLSPLVPGVYEKLFPNLDFTGSRYTRPEVVFEDRLVLQGDPGRVEVAYYGPAHTLGDSIVVVPWAKTVFAGDLVFNGVTPLALDGSVRLWEQRLARLQEEYGGWRIIGGHGPPADEGVLVRLRQYMRHLLGATAYLVERGLRDPVEIALRATNGPLTGWREEERLVLNVARALLDLEGRPPGELAWGLEDLARMMEEYARRRRGAGGGASGGGPQGP